MTGLQLPFSDAINRPRVANLSQCLSPASIVRCHDAARTAAIVAALLALQLIFIRAMRRRIGPEPLNPADLLTGIRAILATGVLAQAVSTERLEAGSGRRVASLVLLTGIVTDWIDGTLARHFGSTRLGMVLDIESDSLLTLAMAGAAVRWGGLSRYVLIPPLLRYIDLARTLRRDAIFTGDDIWWCRASGAAQMLTFLFALTLAPHQRRRYRLRRASIAVSTVQIVTQLLDARRRFGSSSRAVPPCEVHESWPLRSSR